MAAAGGENLIENGDFSALCGSVPDEWYGFGWCSIAVAEEKHLLYDGKKPCKAFKRSYTYSGMAQPVQYVLETGCRYRFSAFARLADDTPTGHKDGVKCTIKLKLSNSSDHQYIRAGEIGDVTSSGWSNMKGRVNMPKVTSDVLMEEATIYFEGPEKEISFLIADVRLWDDTPKKGTEKPGPRPEVCMIGVQVASADEAGGMILTEEAEEEEEEEEEEEVEEEEAEEEGMCSELERLLMKERKKRARKVNDDNHALHSGLVMMMEQLKKMEARQEQHFAEIKQTIDAQTQRIDNLENTISNISDTN